MIHVNICRSVKVNAVSQGAEMLWIRILTLVDDNGNYDRDPMLVYASGAKHKKGVKLEHVSKWMDELIEIGLLQTYSFEDQQYIHFADFHDYQHLRADRGVVVTWPLHPEDMGNGFLESGTAASVRRETETNGQPIDNQSDNHKVHQLPANPHHQREVEVKREVKDEVEGTDCHNEESIKTNEQWWQQDFSPMFKRMTDVRPKPFTRELESCGALHRKYSTDDIKLAASIWFEEKGRLDRKQKQWAAKNFLEDAPGIIDDLIDERIHPKAPRIADDHLPLIVNER